jgi:hypothetical protein
MKTTPNSNYKLLSEKVKKLYQSKFGITLSDLHAKKVLNGLISIVKKSIAK